MNNHQALEYVISLLYTESKRCLHYRNLAKKQGKEKEMEALYWDKLYHETIEAECKIEDIQNLLSKHS